MSVIPGVLYGFGFLVGTGIGIATYFPTRKYRKITETDPEGFDVMSSVNMGLVFNIGVLHASSSLIEETGSDITLGEYDLLISPFILGLTAGTYTGIKVMRHIKEPSKNKNLETIIYKK